MKLQNTAKLNRLITSLNALLDRAKLDLNTLSISAIRESESQIKDIREYQQEVYEELTLQYEHEVQGLPSQVGAN